MGTYHKKKEAKELGLAEEERRGFVPYICFRSCGLQNSGGGELVFLVVVFVVVILMVVLVGIVLLGNT